MQNEYILKYQGKELKMPQWGDMNDFIMIRTQYDLQILPLSMGIGNRAYCGTPLGRNTTHELNTKFNGLFKDCVYGGGDDIAVKVKTETLQRRCKSGDIFLKREPNKEDTYIILRSVGGSQLIPCYWFTLTNKEKVLTSWCTSIDALIMLNNPVYKGNLLDEYLEGKNELAKMCGFE